MSMSTWDSRSADIRIATVVDINEDGEGNRTLMMTDSDTSQSFSIPLSAPGGIYPRPGDTWLMTKELGFWALDRCINLVSQEANPDRTIGAILDTLTERGLITTSFGGGSDPEAPHLAKIGETRWFNYTPDPFWWPEADGATVQRSEYRELGSVLSPGTSTTFDLPMAPILGDSVPHVCAR